MADDDHTARIALARHLRPGDIMHCGALPPRTVGAVDPTGESDSAVAGVVTVRFTDGTRWYVRLAGGGIVYRYRPGQVEKREPSRE